MAGPCSGSASWAALDWDQFRRRSCSWFPSGAKLLSGATNRATHPPSALGTAGFWDVGPSELTPAQGRPGRAGTLSWGPGSVSVTSFGGKSLSVEVQIEQVSRPPWCRGTDQSTSCATPLSVPQVLPNARRCVPTSARHRPHSSSVLHTSGGARGRVPWVTRLPERPTVLSDMGRDRRGGAGLVQGHSASS